MDILSSIDLALRKLGSPAGPKANASGPRTPIPELQQASANIAKLHTSSDYASPGPQPPPIGDPALPSLEVPDELKARLHAVWVWHAKTMAVHNGALSPAAAHREFIRRQEAVLADPVAAKIPDPDNRDLLTEYTRRRKLLLRRYWLEHGAEHVAAFLAATRIACGLVETAVNRVREVEEAVADAFALPAPRPGDVLRALLSSHSRWVFKVTELEKLQAQRAEDSGLPNGSAFHLGVDHELLAACGVQPPTAEELADAPATATETPKGKARK